ncbi:MAG: hypothetical protein N5838_04835, partial [Lactobacillus iners]|nr:hypothetical protein [Lactobacillus iners]
MQKKHRKKCYIWLITIITMFFTLYLGAGYYFYQVAFVPGHKSFLKKHKACLLYTSDAADEACGV